MLLSLNVKFSLLKHSVVLKSLKFYISLHKVSTEKYTIMYILSICNSLRDLNSTGKSLSEALLFTEHKENMLRTEIVLNVRNNFCTQHVLPRFELGIFMY